MTARARRGFVLAVAALAALFVAAQVVRSVEPLALDQALFACFTRWVPRGLLPYRDLFDSKPPLFLYSYALARLLPGELVRSIWLLEALWLAATMGVAFALARRVWDRWAGLAAAALLFVAEWTPGWGGWWSRAQADEFAALPLVAAALLAWRAVDAERLALWAGVLTGVAGLFKIPSMAVAAAWPLTWLLVAGARPAVKRTAWMALGIAAPWALAAGWFAAHRAFGDFVDGVFVYHRYNAAYIAPPWSAVLPEFARTLAVAGALPLAAAAVGVACAARKERIWLGAWIGTTTLAVALERQLAGYQYLLAMPALAGAGGFGVAHVLRNRRTVAVGLA
ncbi:MAG TPA: glycosyltransferase family 39 protein, partial [Polyangia bacterium]